MLLILVSVGNNSYTIGYPERDGWELGMEYGEIFKVVYSLSQERGDIHLGSFCSFTRKN